MPEYYPDEIWRANAQHGLLGVTEGDARPEFDRWLTEHDAQVAARALRDAAEAINYRDADTIRSEGWGEKRNGPTTALDVIRWLRTRAARIEGGDPT